MRRDDFEIGRPFDSAAGTWLCTDKGTRVITAIRLSESPSPGSFEEPRSEWLAGAPYAVEGVVFDEYDQEGCSLEPITQDF